MTTQEKIEYARARAQGAAVFGRDRKEAAEWLAEVKRLEAEAGVINQETGHVTADELAAAMGDIPTLFERSRRQAARIEALETELRAERERIAALEKELDEVLTSLAVRQYEGGRDG